MSERGAQAEVPTTPPRPAEEIAERVVADLGLDPATEDKVRDAMSRLIEQSRAEGAAAERERVAGIVQGMIDARDSSITYVRAVLETVLVAIGPMQHRDLAGRIRALVQEYAGRWADAAVEAESLDDHSTVDACVAVITFMVRAHKQARRSGAIAPELLREMRKLPGGVVYREAICKAADELEAIVRDAGEQR
jgi:hypothetical protein